MSAIGGDPLARDFTHAVEDWDDEFLARTIDEIVANALPSVTVPSDASAPRHADQSTEDEIDVEIDHEMEIEMELSQSADVTDAARRMRHREAMQRCRERKRARMSKLEKQRRRLKSLLHERLWKLRQRDEPIDRPPSEGGVTVETLRKLFMDAVRLKEELLDERDGLHQSLLAHQKYEKIVASATKQIVNEPTAPPALGGAEGPIHSDSVEDPDASSSSGHDSTDTTSNPPTHRSTGRPAGHWVQYLDQEDPLFYEPESDASVAAHTRDCFLRVRRLQDGFQHRVAGLDIHDTYCLGWHAQHTLVRGSPPDSRLELRFRFTRRVPLQRMSLDEIQQATWDVMKDPVQNARLYSALVVCKIVQFIGQDTFIFVRNAPDPDKRLHIRYFSMHAQTHYRTDNGERATVTLMTVLDKDPHVVETPGKSTTPVIWLKHGTLYLGFTEKLDADEIEIEYGGATACISDQHAAYLLTEVGGALMRWERMVIPQQLLL